jgi:cytidine deaminase
MKKRLKGRAATGGAGTRPVSGELALLAMARRAGRKAYAPYSKFRVGAALLAGDGRVFTGCNVENASYGLSQCAERNAVARAVAEGCRDFRAIAVASDRPEPASPCGACRQVLAEFNRRMKVITAGRKGGVSATRLDRLLPSAFGPEDLRKKE